MLFDFKKVFLGVAVLAILSSMVFAMSPNAQGANAQNQGLTSGSGTQIQTTTENEAQTQTQTRTNNPGTGTMTQSQIEAQIQKRIEETKPDYVPRSEMAKEKMSAVAKIAEELIFVAEDLEDQNLGEMIREVARVQSENYDAINRNIDNVVKRSDLAKFFIGPNYSELKVMKQTMEENRNQIRQMEQIMAQITNESDKIRLATQIINMQQLQLELQDQLGELTRGFSLFGWLNRWIRGY